MSNTPRSDSSDEDDSFNLTRSSDNRNSWVNDVQSSSSDSEDDFEVVESGGTPQSSTYEPTNSHGEESPCRISYFYNQPYENYKSEPEEPSYSLDDPTNGDNSGDDHYESQKDSINSKRSSKKKKEKSSKNNEFSSVPSHKKHSKRKRNDDYDAKPIKRPSYDYSETYSGSSQVEPYYNATQSPSSSDRSPLSYYESGQMSHGYKPERSTFKSSPPLPNLSESEDDIPRFSHYEEREEKQKLKKELERRNLADRVDLKTRIDSTNKGNLLMQKMGYREGMGLGKNAQGRVEPVELSKQKGRRGLGLSLPGLDDNQSVEWDPSLEEIRLREPIEWLENHDYDILDYETMITCWLHEGQKNLDIETMTDFVDEELLSSILQKKSVFDNLTDAELSRTISRSNPFETIRKSIFMNRAAVKMANMDCAFDWMFTNPRKKKAPNECMVNDNELLYFADVCAGPGGFSEYVLWRKKWRAKGIGFTLKGDCDFKIQDFNAGSSETFEPYYGVHDDGNIYNPENIKSLTEFVMKITDNKGVHFMMADGGFSVKGQENIQELLSKQLYLCQFLVALNIVREEGHFVCKLFDLFSPFSAGLIYLIYRAFDRICIFKPNSSRPANSERYIICKHRKRNIEEIREYLFKINEKICKLGSTSDKDIVEIVPLAIIKDNVEFFNYLRDSNNRLGNQQLVSLNKVIAYYKDPSLHEMQQNAMRKQCMELWQIPSGPRRNDQSETTVIETIMKNVLNKKYQPVGVSGVLSMKGKKLTPDNLKELFGPSILDWECVPLGAEKLVFILGLGKNRVCQWSGSRWNYDDKVVIELPPGTLLYGEFVPEYRGEGMSQKKQMAFHIIDGIALGYENIFHYDYCKRIKILNLFASALKKYNNNILCPIRVKSPREMKDIQLISDSVVNLLMKRGAYDPCLASPGTNLAIQMKGLCFIRTTKDPWHKHLSKKTNLPYYFSSATNQSFFNNERPKESVATTIDSLENQVLWLWEEGVGYKGESRVEGVLHRDDLLTYIQQKCH